ncbi:GGDEF domain-containing protein [Frankia sp. CcI49]|uniref:putative bifunctional diguanylate cyclase/phosphodiesterase n=1 Tax=Frankia sp. CcI49 TaxID=1745382 RepID=UPI000976D3A0|nr:EAL domain-containing protein [Frankia sp. CcI49]ONH54819.1 GGDEF domain-containing protein [Frankia sp. CcI49]
MTIETETADLADRWFAEITAVDLLPLAAADARAWLAGLAAELLRAVRGESCQPEVGYDVGARLAYGQVASGEALGRTVALLGRHLAQPYGAPARSLPNERIMDLLGELVRGHTESLRERARDGQAALRRADRGALVRAERERRISQSRLNAIVNGAALGVLVVDRASRILEASDVALDILGLSTHRPPVSWPLDEIVHPADREMVARLWQEARHGRSRGECRILRPDGTPMWIVMTLSTTQAGAGAGGWFGVATIEDITERHRLQEEVRFHARHDPLTGLANRAAFLDRLETAFREAGPSARIGLCFLDIDRFKMINEGFGYEAGDQLLVEVARRLARVVAAPGPVPTVARMGGDEFVILVPDSAGLDEITGIARRCLAALRDPIRVDERDLPITCSIGVVEMAVADTRPGDLVAAADASLTWAKRGGKNQWTAFDPDRGTREATRGLLSRSMSPGLARGEFSLAYQPIVDLRDATMAGAEALLRWDHPHLGPTRPGEFIDLAEDSGFIVELGQWVLERACEVARDWPAHMFVSVNLSGRQLREPGLVKVVERILARTGLPAQRLQLELTESVLMDSGGRQVGALHELNALGVRIVIDDFGTGWSNFAYLSTMPVRGLKLAGLFVAKLGKGTEPGRDDHLVEAIVEFARKLRLSVTAEGIETSEQAAALRAFGADLGQGHLFGEPVSAGKFAATTLPRACAAS